MYVTCAFCFAFKNIMRHKQIIARTTGNSSQASFGSTFNLKPITKCLGKLHVPTLKQEGRKICD